MRSGFAVVALSILMGCAMSRGADSAPRSLPPEVLAALKEPGGFEVRASVSAIPGSVRSSFAKATGEEFAMAEPGANWQSTDVGPVPGLPYRRLVKVALSRSWCVLFYERGGIARCNHVAVFRLSRNGAALVWRAITFLQVIADPAGLLAAIEKGQVQDVAYL